MSVPCHSRTGKPIYHIPSFTCLLVLLLIFGIPGSSAQDKTVTTSGDVVLFVMPTIALGSTFIKKDKEGTRQFAKGFILNQAVTFSLKKIFTKPRPDLSDNNAFPSGHTSTTFQSAAFIQQRYGWKFGIPAYALAGFTGYSRINAEKHDGWDILAGALIGIGSTYLFTTPYQKEHMALTFTGRERQYMIGFTYSFQVGGIPYRYDMDRSMKKRIKEMTAHSCFFRQQIGIFLEENEIEIQDVIGISSSGDFTTLWYWG